MTDNVAFLDIKVPQTWELEWRVLCLGTSSSTRGMLKVSENMDVDRDINPDAVRGFDMRQIQARPRILSYLTTGT